MTKSNLSIIGYLSTKPTSSRSEQPEQSRNIIMKSSPAPDPKLVKRTNEIAGKIHSMLPKGFGFIVMIFPFGTGESDEPVMNYASNAQLEDVLGVLREFIARTAKEFGKKL